MDKELRRFRADDKANGAFYDWQLKTHESGKKWRDLYSVDGFQDIHDLIVKRSCDYLSMLGRNSSQFMKACPKAELFIWIAGLGHKDGHHEHHHHLSTLSGVYYPTGEIPQGAGQLLFFDPRGPYPPFHTASTGRVLPIRPQPGMFIMFPSWLRHKVEHNYFPHGGRRIAVSFNFHMPMSEDAWRTTSPLDRITRIQPKSSASPLDTSYAMLDSESAVLTGALHQKQQPAANPRISIPAASQQQAKKTVDLHKRGHLRPLGEQRPSLGHVKIVSAESMTPKELFREYETGSKLQGTPVVFKGLVVNSKAYQKFGEGAANMGAADDYLLAQHENSDNKMSSVEVVKKESRVHNTARLNTYSFKEFLQTYNESGAYAATLLSDTKVGNDLELPKVLRSCAMLNRIAKMNLWFSSGGTTSVVHQDGPQQNLNCVLAGKKRILMFPPGEIKKIVEDDMGWVHATSLSSDDEMANTYGAFAGRIDVDRMDLDKYPGWSHVNHYHAEIEAGDCVFIPAFWLHQVRSEGRNVAANIWLHKIPGKATTFEDLEEACQDHPDDEATNRMLNAGARVRWSDLKEINTRKFLRRHPNGQRELWSTITDVFPALAERAKKIF